MLYHVSPKAGLKILQPHKSTHKKAYVYAIENMVTGIRGKFNEHRELLDTAKGN